MAGGDNSSNGSHAICTFHAIPALPPATGCGQLSWHSGYCPVACFSSKLFLPLCSNVRQFEVKQHNLAQTWLKLLYPEQSTSDQAATCNIAQHKFWSVDRPTFAPEIPTGDAC